MGLGSTPPPRCSPPVITIHPALYLRARPTYIFFYSTTKQTHHHRYPFLTSSPLTTTTTTKTIFLQLLCSRALLGNQRKKMNINSSSIFYHPRSSDLHEFILTSTIYIFNLLFFFIHEVTGKNLNTLVSVYISKRYYKN